MHSRDRLPTVASFLPSSLRGQAEAEAGVGGEGSGGGGGGEQVQQDQLMHGALFQVILQQLGELLVQMTHFSCCPCLLDGLTTMTVMRTVVFVVLWTTMATNDKDLSLMVIVYYFAAFSPDVCSMFATCQLVSWSTLLNRY